MKKRKRIKRPSDSFVAEFEQAMESVMDTLNKALAVEDEAYRKIFDQAYKLGRLHGFRDWAQRGKK